MTLSPSTRYKKYSPTVETTLFVVPFPLFDDSDLSVLVEGQVTDAYTVSATYLNGRSDDAEIILSAATVGVDVEIFGTRQARTDRAIGANTPDLIGTIGIEMDRLAATQQEQQFRLGLLPGYAGAISELLAVAIEDLDNALHMNKRTLLTVDGQQVYSAASNGTAMNLTQTNHIIMGPSPAGLLTYGVDYTVVDGDLSLNFSPEADELYHIVSMPRLTNTEATAVLAAYKDEVEALIDSKIRVYERTTAAFAFWRDTLLVGEVTPSVDGLFYERANVTGTDSCTNDLGVDGFIPHGERSVLHYGTPKDGSAGADVGFNAALKGGNVKVKVTNGVYRCDAHLRLYANTHLEMDPFVTILDYAINRPLFLNGEYGNLTYATGYTGDGNITIEGGVIDMAAKIAALSQGPAFAFGHAENVWVLGTEMKNNYQAHFIEFNACRRSGALDCYMHDTTLATPGTREAVNIDYAYAGGFPHFGGYDLTVCDDIQIGRCKGKNVDVMAGSHSQPTGALNQHQSIKVYDCVIDGAVSWALDPRFWNPFNSRIDRTEIKNLVTPETEYRGMAKIDGRFLANIADDGIATFPLPPTTYGQTAQGMAQIVGHSSNTNSPRGQYYVHTTDGITRIATGGLDTAVDLSTAVLTGTTGVDGRVTMSVVAASGTTPAALVIENRRGSSLVVDVKFPG